ncbi:antibiotic biosynthesis monooxygenase [Wielerella bovis]|uniref:putative quinol monooxygenase n=1 Tax=Wielerella bovis TaxID=2917790 RepID=UPI002019E979|nr:antibiotic biosynthesis monooxygenase family protein [Wielerella bovis]ULJ61748.1 antibiotic biosynthesis monooxygenase [Wielerella bovis]
MIGVYATCDVKNGNQAEFEALAREFAQTALTYAGCIYYDFGKVSGTRTRYVFMEKWQSKDDWDRHLAAPFFVSHAPDLVALTLNGLDINMAELSET